MNVTSATVHLSNHRVPSTEYRVPSTECWSPKLETHTFLWVSSLKLRKYKFQMICVFMSFKFRVSNHQVSSTECWSPKLKTRTLKQTLKLETHTFLWILSLNLRTYKFQMIYIFTSFEFWVSSLTSPSTECRVPKPKTQNLNFETWTLKLETHIFQWISSLELRTYKFQVIYIFTFLWVSSLKSQITKYRVPSAEAQNSKLIHFYEFWVSS